MIDNILLVLFLLLFCAKLAGSLMEKLGLDSTLGELLTGIIFGASCLKIINASSIEEFAVIGSVLILFVAGMKEENIEEIYRDKLATGMGLSLLFVTGVIMTSFFYIIPRYFGITFSILQSIIMGIAFSIIDVGVPAKVMISKGLISLPVGKITIRSSIINIIIGLLLFTVSSLFLSQNLLDIGSKIAGILLFLGLIVTLIFCLSRLSRVVMRLHMEEAEFSLAIILVLFLAYLSETIGFSSALGAFIAGQLVGRMPFSETKSFTDKIKSISFGIFIPLFFVWLGLGVIIADIMANLVLSLIIFVIYTLIRFGVAYAFLKKNKMDSPALISSTLLSVDVESLVILIVATRLGIFTNSLPLSLFVPSCLFSTLLIVLLVNILSRKKLQVGEAGQPVAPA